MRDPAALPRFVHDFLREPVPIPPGAPWRAVSVDITLSAAMFCGTLRLTGEPILGPSVRRRSVTVPFVLAPPDPGVMLAVLRAARQWAVEEMSATFTRWPDGTPSPGGVLMTEPAHTPALGVPWCPTCEPERDMTREILDVRYCPIHTPSWAGADDPAGTGAIPIVEAGGEANRNMCDLIHGGER